MAGNTADPNSSPPQRKRKTLTLPSKLAKVGEHASDTDRLVGADDSGLGYTQQAAEEDDRGLH